MSDYSALLPLCNSAFSCSSVAFSGTEKIMECSPDTVWCRVASLYTFC